MSLPTAIFVGIVMLLLGAASFVLGENIYKKRHREHIFNQSACIVILLFIAVVIVSYR